MSRLHFIPNQQENHILQIYIVCHKQAHLTPNSYSVLHMIGLLEVWGQYNCVYKSSMPLRLFDQKYSNINIVKHKYTLKEPFTI